MQEVPERAKEVRGNGIKRIRERPESLEDRTRLVREKKRAELRVQLMRKLNRVIQEDSVYFRNRVKGAVEEQSQTKYSSQSSIITTESE